MLTVKRGLGKTASTRELELRLPMTVVMEHVGASLCDSMADPHGSHVRLGKRLPRKAAKHLLSL